MNNPTLSRFRETGAAIKIAQTATIAATVFLFSGCESTPESHVVSAPPPANSGAVVVAQPQQVQQPQSSQVVVVQAPPALQQEVPQAQPSSDHVWIAGYWTWRNSRYEWIPGRWELPPRSSAVWVAPRWERLSNGTYRFYEGYWN
jgi:hypothetical protein